MLSFSRDLELRVWGVQDQVCLQVCHRFQELLPQPPSAFCLHPRTGALLVGTNQVRVIPSLLTSGENFGGSQLFLCHCLFLQFYFSHSLSLFPLQLGVLEPCRDEELKTDVGGTKAGKTLSHERPLTTALYNTQFNQVSHHPTSLSLSLSNCFMYIVIRW